MILVDFETTGLLSANPNPAAQPGIVQIGIVEVDSVWEEIGTWQSLVNPEKPSEAEAIKAHGISDERVRNEPTFPALFSHLSVVFRRHDTWVGFNNSFDRNILWHQLMRYNLAQKFPWPSIDIDIMKIGRDVANIAGKRDTKYPKLEELHVNLFGKGFPQAHDAIADCMATLRCAKELSNKGYINL